jgi:hypothetical protein
LEVRSKKRHEKKKKMILKVEEMKNIIQKIKKKRKLKIEVKI